MNAAPLWTPAARRVAASNLTRFASETFALHGAGTGDYETLWQWSVADRESFWSALYEYAGIVGDRGPGPVLLQGDRLPGARWFAGTKLNFAENLLSRRDAHVALVFVNERGARRSLSYAELATEVARVAAGLRALGVVAGDRVAGLLPNLPEAVVAMLATTSLGAVWSSCSPDFGQQGVLDRFGQIGPKVLFAADGYVYAGKTLTTLGTLRALVEQLPGLLRVVVVPYLAETLGRELELNEVPRAVSYAAFGKRGAPLKFERVAFDAPLYIMYSSGTTGVPKCIVHSVGGSLLQHRKEHLLHVDLRPEDRLFFFTTCGWMMWNWLVSGLASGCTLILYEGSPFHPGPEVLWRMAAAEGITIFGTSPKYLAALEKDGYVPREQVDLAALRTILSTGSPLAPEQYDYVYAKVAADLQLASISGGTDILSCFCLGNPWSPVYRGEIQCRGLGMNVAILDDAGRPVVGQPGELVCTAAFPSVPIGFWNDPEGQRFHEAYFARYPDIWQHGDFAELTPRGSVIITGRSDAVLNPGGVRIGTAEIYRQVERLPEILESIAVGQDWDRDVRVVLFVRLRPGVELDAALEQRVRDVIRSHTSPRHVPAKILAVPDIPRTISGKLVELAVRNVIHGKPVKNTDALANPGALEHFRDRVELRT